ncbi:MAG: glutamate--cysteine ligase [Mariprofundaceae bacterium]|nr:glutamate--cysteine ligase [Mariprofundaceae bacterium]
MKKQKVGTILEQKRIYRENLADYFRDGCKPKAAWKIGTEHEKIGFCNQSLRPIPYFGEKSIEKLLQRLADCNHDEQWLAVLEDGHPIALKNGLASITLEPGGQLELSGAPLATIHETHAEVGQHFDLLRQLTKEMEMGFLGLGFQPKWKREDIAWMPKSRYQVMRDYMPKVGDLGLDMMLRTATTQANLDFSDEADMAKKMRVAYCLQPLVTALFAASPFIEGKPSGLLSARANCWLDTDAKRTGVPSCVFEDDFGFEAWTEWVLDVPMYFVMRDATYIDCAGASFRDFLEGDLSILPHQYPTYADWELHVSTTFPEVRLKQFIEVRGADAGGWAWISALPALWKGLLYDAEALNQAWDMIQDWSHEDVLYLCQNTPKTALKTEFLDKNVQYHAQNMLDIAEAGLNRIQDNNEDGHNESIYLKPLLEVASSGETQAERWFNSCHEEWQQSVDPMFETAAHP